MSVILSLQPPASDSNIDTPGAVLPYSVMLRSSIQCVSLAPPVRAANNQFGPTNGAHAAGKA